MTPTFPSVLLAKDGYSAFYVSDCDLKITSYRSVSNGFWDKAILYDSNFIKWKIIPQIEEGKLILTIKGFLGLKGNMSHKFEIIGKYDFMEIKGHFLENINICGDLYQNAQKAKSILAKSSKIIDIRGICLGSK